MQSQRVTFPGAFGHDLAARLDRSEEPPRACALFAHCFTCSKDLKATARISRALVERGIAVLRFDFTGLGESEGDFADTNFSSNLEDLLAAVDYMRREHQAPSLLIGHSLGGAAVLATAGRVDEAVAVATIGAPSDTGHLGEGILRSAPELEEADEAQVVLAGRPFRIRRQLIDDLAEQNVLSAVRKLDRALLVLHSPVDDVVDIDHARRIYQAARHPKSFVSLDTADHLLLEDPADARYVAEVLAAWAGRYIGSKEETDEAPAEPTATSLPHGEVRVTGGGNGYRQVVRAGRHELAADEPTSVGGTDVGPNPYDYLLAAVGTCTNMTLRMYADRKKWPLEGVETALRHSKIHADDCQECQSESGKIDLIEKELQVHGPLSDEQRERLLEIAGRCPVHRTMTSETVIRSRLV
ncbi:MAG: OsmC family protein [bacterium]|nr:OsmC family protein [bacterium]